jgi:hypothetical protein
MFLLNSPELQKQMGYSSLMQPRPAQSSQSSSSPLWSRQAQSESFSYSNRENLDSKVIFHFLYRSKQDGDAYIRTFYSHPEIL